MLNTYCHRMLRLYQLYSLFCESCDIHCKLGNWKLTEEYKKKIQLMTIPISKRLLLYILCLCKASGLVL